MIEKPLLTEEQVKSALERQGDFGKHPVIAVLDKYLPEITELNKEYLVVAGNPKHERALRSKLAFLIDPLFQVTPYSLSALDTIAIWSRVVELFPTEVSEGVFEPSPYRMALSGIIPITQAVHDQCIEWRGFPYSYLMSGRLPANAPHDKDSMILIHQRLKEAVGNAQEIEAYTKGSREDLNSLLQACKKGDQAALERVREAEEIHRSRYNPVFADIYHSIGNYLANATSLLGYEIRNASII